MKGQAACPPEDQDPAPPNAGQILAWDQLDLAAERGVHSFGHCTDFPQRTLLQGQDT